MFSLRVISCVLTFGLLASSANAFVQRSMCLHGSLINLQFYDGKLYIGGTDRIYVLNEDLSKYQSASTCDRPRTSCENVNQLLLVNKFTKELLVCGTGNDGICDVRKLDNIELVTRNSSGIRAPLRVSSDASRPAQALVIQKGSITVAVTYGKGINVTEIQGRSYLSYKYAISTRNFVNFEVGLKVLNIQIQNLKFYDYIIYYKASFQFNRYTYFVTNQKNYVGGSNYLSKLVRLCQNDSDFNSYTDIVLQCMHNGTAYNLIQDATVLRRRNLPKNASSDAIFVGVFFRGNDPNNHTGDSVICMSMLQDLDNEILIAKKIHALTYQLQDRPRRYLPNLYSSSTRSNKKDLSFQDYDYSCENANPKFLYVIGNTTFSMESRYKVNARNGFVTTVDGELTGEGDAVVFIGTSKGNIYQMSQSNLSSPLEVFNKVNVADPVKRIYIKDDDKFYVMGSRKVFLLLRSNCSEFTTCNATVKGRNPLCGWCVYKQRATRRTDCSTAPNHWVSSLKNCMHNTYVTPSRIPVLKSSKTNVSLTITPGVLPEPLAGDMYLCKLLNGSGVIATLEPKMIGRDFTCTLPRIQEYTEATLQFSVKTLSQNTAVLFTAPILFFECAYFRCGECRSRSIQNCVWCTEEATCKDKGSPCSSVLTNSTDVCPRLKDMRGQYFVHAGVMTFVNFRAEHIQKTAYTCKVLSLSLTSTTVSSGDSIFCSFNITKMLDVPKQDYMVKVNYAAHGKRTSELDDTFGNFVTVYRCSLLATDCIHCQALNKSRYNCGWCANKGVCGYKDENCFVRVCPAPTITKVLPVNGPTIGQTKITVFGYNLASDISDVESVEVASVPCSLSKNANDFLVKKSPDFNSNIPSRIVCYTGSSENETSGFLKMTIKGKVSVSPLKYSYKIPVITMIHPRIGPKAGGTRITIDGQNLGIGNRNISVMLGNKFCLKPAVKPDIPLEYVFSGNGTIVCTVDVGYSDNVTTLSLSIDGAKVINSTPIPFLFVDDPLIHTITTKKAFLRIPSHPVSFRNDRNMKLHFSGGTEISFEGTGMTNANEAKVTLSYEGETMVGECEIKSQTLVVCKVPRAPQGVADELFCTNGSSECSGCIRKTAVLNLDNVQDVFEIEFYTDPEIHHIDEENDVIKLKSSQRRLKISGKRLNQVATTFDIKVTVGIEPCVLAQLKPLFISCIAPRYQPKPGIPNAELPELNVTIGNIRKMVGYVQYEDDIDVSMVIVVSAVTAVVLIYIICLSTFLMYRKKKRAQCKLKTLVKQNSPRLRHNIETIMHNPRVVSRLGNNGLYTDIDDSRQADIYTSINKERLEETNLSTSRARRENEQTLTDLYMTPVHENRNCKDFPCKIDMSSAPKNYSLRLRQNVTTQIVFVENNKEGMVLAPKELEAECYLLPVSCEEDENLQSEEGMVLAPKELDAEGYLLPVSCEKSENL